MKKSVLVFTLAAITVASTVQAELNVSVNLGVPPARVVVSSPSVRFEVAPLFVAPSRLGFYVGVDTPYDIIFNSDYYYLYYGNSWHNSRHYNGPWVEVPYRDLPPNIRKHRIEQIRSNRDREYRTYRNDRDHYRGRQFRPDRERREEPGQEHRRGNEEMRDGRRHGNEEMRDGRRHGNEEVRDGRGRGNEEMRDDRRRDKDELKNDRRRDKDEIKNDRRRDRDESKDDRRRDQEERKDERRDGRQHGGRD